MTSFFIPRAGSITRSLLSTDEFRLVDALRRGDKDAARQLYQTLYPITRRAVRAKTRGSTLPTDDLVQTTLERVHVSLTSGLFAGECSLATWVDAVANTTIRDARRARSREREGLLAYANTSSETLDAERQMHLRDELRTISDRIGRMKSPYAKVIFAAGVLGMTLQEVASRTDASVAATQSRLRRARERLWRGHLLDEKRGSAVAAPP